MTIPATWNSIASFCVRHSPIGDSGKSAYKAARFSVEADLLRYIRFVLSPLLLLAAIWLVYRSFGGEGIGASFASLSIATLAGATVALLLWLAGRSFHAAQMRRETNAWEAVPVE